MPGDRIELEAGDNIPADARLIEAFAFRVQEAALTGESVPVDKDAGCVLDEATPLGDRRNMVYMGTVVAAGKGARRRRRHRHEHRAGPHRRAARSATSPSRRRCSGGWPSWARC